MLIEILRAGILLAFLGWGAVLAVIDVRTHRLPNRIVLPAYPIAIVALGVLAVADGDAHAFLRAVLGGLVLFGAYAVLRGIRGSGLGGLSRRGVRPGLHRDAARSAAPRQRRRRR